jgi:hypothetical protein
MPGSLVHKGKREPTPVGSSDIIERMFDTMQDLDGMDPDATLAYAAAADAALNAAEGAKLCAAAHWVDHTGTTKAQPWPNAA